MRYCTSSIRQTPLPMSLSTLSNMVSPSPSVPPLPTPSAVDSDGSMGADRTPFSALRLFTVGASCLWSPARTRCLPLRIGIQHADSRACRGGRREQSAVPWEERGQRRGEERTEDRGGGNEGGGFRYISEREDIQTVPRAPHTRLRVMSHARTQTFDSRLPLAIASVVFVDIKRDKAGQLRRRVDDARKCGTRLFIKKRCVRHSPRTTTRPLEYKSPMNQRERVQKPPNLYLSRLVNHHQVELLVAETVRRRPDARGQDNVPRPQNLPHHLAFAGASFFSERL